VPRKNWLGRLTTKKAPRFPEALSENVVLGCRLASPPLAAAAVATSAATAAAIAATVAAAATTAAIAAAAAAVAAATTAATTRACFTRTRFVHGQGPAFDRLAIELRDRFLRIGLIGHGDKREAARFTGKFVLHQGDFRDRARLGEEVLEVGFGRIEGKISYV
jgi:hypothetical protein